ncbi:copper ion binding protein [Tamaricihabitans halophyticus]|uniref:Copper ion binding protein n=1 Tax=Tamaricihabitans halophyticus TaxID=1262583 RepID=A0A4R2QXS5_9PSEU|nr:heavy-metal-associated domain-containing protein [Tamaricihabitans halophyticus]TCP53969.1 copper ion binding protein [Tamaricihabitans halophyticus]
MTEATYTVTGMTCDHCASSVTEEVSKLAGVSQVDVELSTGAVTVTSAAPLPAEQLREAVEEAGYTLSGA